MLERFLIKVYIPLREPVVLLFYFIFFKFMMKIISYLIKLLLCIFKCFIIVAVLINVQITWVIPATKISTCIGAKWAPSNWRGSCSNFNRVGCHTPDSWFVSKFQLSPLSSLYCSLCQLQPKTHKTEKVKHKE